MENPPMQFNARMQNAPEDKAAFLEWLTSETVSTLRRSIGDAEALKAAAFLFSNRAREAGIAEPDIAEILGISIARASLSEGDEQCVLDWVESFDPITKAVHRPQKQKHWWKIWQ